MSTSREIPCGCKFCGCMCADHSPDRSEIVCAAHGYSAVARFVVQEGVRLAVVSLFCGILLIWAAVFSIL